MYLHRASIISRPRQSLTQLKSIGFRLRSKKFHVLWIRTDRLPLLARRMQPARSVYFACVEHIGATSSSASFQHTRTLAVTHADVGADDLADRVVALRTAAEQQYALREGHRSRQLRAPRRLRGPTAAGQGEDTCLLSIDTRQTR